MKNVTHSGKIRKHWFVLILLGLFACGRSPTEPGGGGSVSSPISGTWSGRLTCGGRPSESVVASVTQSPGNVTMRFASSCYGNAVFEGGLKGFQLTGQLRVPQTTCREEGGFADATGASIGTANPSHIHLETDAPGTADCDIAPASTLDLSR
jgi:hypothetical protein